MLSHDLPEVSPAPAPAADPCTAARCGNAAETAVVLRLGGVARAVRCCASHARRWAATERARSRAALAAAR